LKNKESKIWLFLLTILIIGFVYWRWSNPPKVKFNWLKTYADGQQDPYDFGVFKSLLQKRSKGSFKEIKGDLNTSLSDVNFKNSTYIFIGRQAYYSKSDIEKLMQMTEQGANVWICAENVPDTILQILGGADSSLLMGSFGGSRIKVQSFMEQDTSIIFNWTVRSFENRADSFEWNYISGTIFNSNTYLRGSIDDGLNYIELQRGKGKFYLHTSPILFSNYSLRNDTGFMYLSSVFKGQRFTDVYYDVGSRKYRNENRNRNKGTSTPLAYILSQRSLRWAWYLFVLMVILFFAFYTKRKQNVIAVLPVKQNFGLRFIDTLVALHLKQGNYKYMSELNMGLFLSYLKKEFSISLNEIESDNYGTIAIKSGVSIQRINLLFERYKQIQNSDEVSQDMFLELGSHIRAFKNLQKIK
jgi:hypothetical protein